jgi:hypothetical protein
MADPRLEAFLAYITKRGIPERFHGLYRDELLGVLLHAGVTSVDKLTPGDLNEGVKAAERMLQNRKAVCAALDEYLRTLRQQGAAPLQPPPASEHEDEIPESARGSAAYPAAGRNEHRRFVRVPLNREVKIEGSLAPIRASDLSLGGVYLETRHTLTVGEVVELEFKLRASDQGPLIVMGEVAYIDPGMGVGVYFIDLPRNVSREIRHFVEDVVAGRQF